MDRDEAARVAEILRANPDGISRAGLMAWSRLRIAPDLTDEQLDAALAELGPAVSIEGGFVRLLGPAMIPAGPRPSSGAWTPDPGAAAGGADPHGSLASTGLAGEGPRSGGNGHGQTIPEPERQGAGPGPEDRPFSSVALLDAEGASSTGSTAEGSAWVAGNRPRRSVRGLMAVAALVVFGVIGLLGRTSSDGSSAGATSVPSDPRGSIAAADELGAGSCFVVPQATTFSEVEIRPCEAAHDGEVVATWDFEQAGSAYPTEAEWEAGVDARCRTGFEAYTGLKLADQSELTYSWFVPAEDAWAQGSRTVQCYLAPVDGSLTRSYRASP